VESIEEQMKVRDRFDYEIKIKTT